MPAGRCAHATCTYNGKIYVFGGTSPDPYSAAQKNVFVYDPQTNTWIQKSNMLYANSLCGVAVVDDRIYIIGGTISSSSSPVSRLMAYNPAIDSWTQKANMPTARSYLSACAVDGKIYAIGGAPQNYQSVTYKNVEVYDPETDSWTRKADMPTGRTALATCVVGGKIFAVGGFSPTAIYTANEMYDPLTDIWTIKSPMQQKRLMPFVGSVGNQVYVIGGSYPDSNMQPIILSTTEQYDTGSSSPDFNSDGIVDAADMCILVEHWQTDYPLCDIAPPPFGDGIVDVQDLIMLAEHLFEEIYPPELIAYWKLNEAEGDIAFNSTSDNHGLLSGSPAWQPETGKVDGALEFDGIDDYIETDFVLNPADGPFSIFAWIKSTVPKKMIISQSNGTGTGDTWLYIDEDGNLMTGLRPPAVGRFVPQPLVSEFIITDGQWHHIGFVWDGSYRSLYANGVEVAKDTTPQNPLKSANGGLYISAGKTLGTGTFFSGLIDDIRIYDIALSPAEIEALFR